MLEIDKRNAFDYGNSRCVGMSIKDLKMELVKEVALIQKKL